MDSKEAGRSCDHNISQLFPGDPVHIFFHVSTDNTLDLIIIVASKLIIALCTLIGCLIIYDRCQFTDCRVFKYIRIYNGNILGKAHHSNLGCGQ